MHICMLSHSVVSNFLQPHGLQPARLLCPWDCPSKKVGVGCHFLLHGSSWPRDQTHISCISCISKCILYHCATWEAYKLTLRVYFHSLTLLLVRKQVCSQDKLQPLFAQQNFAKGCTFSSIKLLSSSQPFRMVLSMLLLSAALCIISATWEDPLILTGDKYIKAPWIKSAHWACFICPLISLLSHNTYDKEILVSANEIHKCQLCSVVLDTIILYTHSSRLPWDVHKYGQMLISSFQNS